ncbi:hypothetical protein [Phytoactinopolyspora halophila]|uniref:hypothetical protein n=1 Tax=Phytoactinopolyspora halophila TaxID=1981511 RepID=UPI000F4D8ECE|nr:hypothetical protein [Phytoactinopolyspora halophila]
MRTYVEITTMFDGTPAYRITVEGDPVIGRWNMAAKADAIIAQMGALYSHTDSALSDDHQMVVIAREGLGRRDN